MTRQTDYIRSQVERTFDMPDHIKDWNLVKCSILTMCEIADMIDYWGSRITKVTGGET